MELKYKAFELALKAMSYTKVKENIYMKPVGVHSFTVRVDNFTWYNYFLAGTRQILLWNCEECPEKYRESIETCLQWIKETERYAKISTDPLNDSNFHLAVYDL